MNSKTPLFIVGIGVLGMIALGVLANTLLEGNPQLQQLAGFREEVRTRFPLSEVALRPSGAVCELRVRLDAARPLEIAAGSESLPPALSALPSFMRAHCPVQPRDQRLQVVVLGAGAGGCRADVPLWQGTFPTEQELTRTRADLAAAGAEGAVLSTPAPNELLVALAARGNGERARELALLARELGGGGWQRVEVRLGELRFAFDADGQRVVR